MTLSCGFLGIILGITTSPGLSHFAGWATKVTISTIFLAAGFAVAIGTFFGIWPAKKAEQLNPIDAPRDTSRGHKIFQS